MVSGGEGEERSFEIVASCFVKVEKDINGRGWGGARAEVMRMFLGKSAERRDVGEGGMGC